MHQIGKSYRIKGLYPSFARLVSLRSTASTAGVVRVVKPNMWNSREGSSDHSSKVDCSILENRPVGSMERTDRVTNDVRVADLFRKYKQDVNNPSVIVSVIDALASIGVEGGILTRFPGFIHLMSDAVKLMNRGSFSSAEIISIIGNLSKLGIRKLSGKTDGLDFDSLSIGLSNQLVSHLESVPKTDLMNSLRLVECDMKISLDDYFYYCLNKELIDWATEQTSSLPVDAYIREVLGPLQNLTLAPIFTRTNVLDNPAIQSKMIHLIRSKSLGPLLTIELISNLQSTGSKSKFFSVIQTGISEILESSNRDRLLADMTDLATIVSGLPSEPLLRDPKIQSELESILLGHLASQPTDSKSIRNVVNCVSDLVVSNGFEPEREILVLAAPVIRNNVSILSQIPENKISNLFYIYSKGFVDFNNDLFRSVCADLEGFVIGRLPKLSSAQLAKLSLSFASGIVNHRNSFRALQASIRRRIDDFSPIEFTEAVFGLAHGGLLIKSTLVPCINRIAEQVSSNYLPKLAWSVAVADYSVPSTWEILISRIEREICNNPQTLESLSSSDESHLYETLVTAKVNNWSPMSRSLDRRLAHFDSRRVKRSEPKITSVIPQMNIEIKQDVDSPTGAKFAALKIPAYLPEYRLILDLTTEPIVHVGSGVTGGSAKLRHNLWSNLGYNVIAVSDAQFTNGEDDRAVVLGKIIDQFVAELEQLPKNPIEPELSGRDQLSRFWQSRDDKREKTTTTESTWESRPANARNNRLDNSQWASRA